MISANRCFKNEFDRWAMRAPASPPMAKPINPQRVVQAHGLSGVMSYNQPQSLAEDVLFAETALTEEAPRIEFELDRDSMPRQVCDHTSVATMQAG
jgi:hypothetical protein